jgi:ribosomal protein S12 methylthiotransferase
MYVRQMPDGICLSSDRRINSDKRVRGDVRMNILFISLGCDKNLVDSEVMLGLLDAKGYQIVDDETQADIIVINTCCFVHDAKEESIQTILEMAEYKTEGRLKALIVTGCLAQRYRQEIIDEIPEVDAVLGTTAYDKIVEAVEEALAGAGHVELENVNALPLVDTKRLVTTGGHYAYMKIAEGCDKHCTYCIIPKLRGNYRSVPMERLIQEAKDLAEQGVKELILVAQETTLYGKDIYGEKSLHKLLRELCKVDGIRWIRILYCYPEEIDDNLIQVMKEEKKLCHYLDLPIQHANDEILKRMGRRTSKAQLEEIIGKLKREIPDITLRTTLITGFPGETEEQHEELKAFVDEMEFDRLGVFTYSPEEDTPAAEMSDQIPEEVKEDRQAEIMELQQEIAFAQAEDMIGEEVLVMIEGKVADENAYVGRTYKDAPGVDGLIFINTDEELMSGDFARVKVTGAVEYDLIGELL